MPPGPSQAGFCFSTTDQLPPGRKRPLTDLGLGLPAPTTSGRGQEPSDRPHEDRCPPLAACGAQAVRCPPLDQSVLEPRRRGGSRADTGRGLRGNSGRPASCSECVRAPWLARATVKKALSSGSTEQVFIEHLGARHCARCRGNTKNEHRRSLPARSSQSRGRSDRHDQRQHQPARPVPRAWTMLPLLAAPGQAQRGLQAGREEACPGAGDHRQKRVRRSERGVGLHQVGRQGGSRWAARPHSGALSWVLWSQAPEAVDGKRCFWKITEQPVEDGRPRGHTGGQRARGPGWTRGPGPAAGKAGQAGAGCGPGLSLWVSQGFRWS